MITSTRVNKRRHQIEGLVEGRRVLFVSFRTESRRAIPLGIPLGLKSRLSALSLDAWTYASLTSSVFDSLSAFRFHSSSRCLSSSFSTQHSSDSFPRLSPSFSTSPSESCQHPREPKSKPECELGHTYATHPALDNRSSTFSPSLS